MVTLGGALFVVLVRNIFHAALFLVASLAAVAGIYVLLNAAFLAVAQVLIYIGAVAVMLIFGIMLTQDTVRANSSNFFWWAGIGLGGTFFAVLIAVIYGANWQTVTPDTEPIAAPLADIIFSTYLLPFEVASVVLLAAIIGAIVIAKER